MAADISKTCISIAAFSAAEDVSEHSVVKISTKTLKAPYFSFSVDSRKTLRSLPLCASA